VFAEYSTNPAYQTADGKPNVTKLKDEAIGKVLAEVIINQSEGITEKPELLVKAQSWWNQILDFLKGLFTTSGFDQLAMDILSGKDIGTAEDIKEGGVFFQLSKQEEIYNNIKELSSKIKKEDDGYSINGKKITRRVSNLVADWYERRFKNKDLTKTEYQTAVDDLKAEKGPDDSGTTAAYDAWKANEQKIFNQHGLINLRLTSEKKVPILEYLLPK
jgi:hypothetical protein